MPNIIAVASNDFKCNALVAKNKEEQDDGENGSPGDKVQLCGCLKACCYLN
jgi:hypothetical protein